jgi:hypothetical protein
MIQFQFSSNDPECNKILLYEKEICFSFKLFLSNKDMKLQKKEKRYTEANESHPELKQREKIITKLQRLKTKLNSKVLKQFFNKRVQS